MPKPTTQNLYGGSVVAELTTRMWGDKEIQKYKVTDSGSEVADLIRVTEALGVINKPALIPWAAKMTTRYLADYMGQPITSELLDEARKNFRNIRDEAADLGTAVHNWIESYIKKGVKDLPDDERILNGITAFLRWTKENDVQFISSERMVYSREHHYIGTMDAEAIVNGNRCVMDWKTSKGIWNEMRYQVAAYQIAAIEEGSEYAGPRWIIRFDKGTSEFEAHELPLEDLSFDMEAFLAALTLKRRELKLKQPNV